MNLIWRQEKQVLICTELAEPITETDVTLPVCVAPLLLVQRPDWLHDHVIACESSSLPSELLAVHILASSVGFQCLLRMSRQPVCCCLHAVPNCNIWWWNHITYNGFKMSLSCSSVQQKLASTCFWWSLFFNNRIRKVLQHFVRTLNSVSNAKGRKIHPEGIGYHMVLAY